MTQSVMRRHSPTRLWLLTALLALTALAAWWPSSEEAQALDLVAARAPVAPSAQTPLADPAEPTVNARPLASASVALRAVLDEDAGGHLFGLGEAQPPREVAERPAPPMPTQDHAQPEIPTPSFVPRGILREANRPLRVLLETSTGDVLVLGAGERVDSAWVIETVQAQSTVVLHLPTQTRTSLSLSFESGAPTSAGELSTSSPNTPPIQPGAVRISPP